MRKRNFKGTDGRGGTAQKEDLPWTAARRRRTKRPAPRRGTSADREGKSSVEAGGASNALRARARPQIRADQRTNQRTNQ
jgi:hypothetical protein